MFQRLQITLALWARRILLPKNVLALITPNCTRNHVINQIALHSVQLYSMYHYLSLFLSQYWRLETNADAICPWKGKSASF